MRAHLRMGQRWRRRSDGAIAITRNRDTASGQVEYFWAEALETTEWPKGHWVPVDEFRAQFELLVSPGEKAA